MGRTEMPGELGARGVSGRVMPSGWWWFGAPASGWWQSRSRGTRLSWNNRGWTEDDEDDEEDGDSFLATREEERKLWNKYCVLRVRR